ncbi:hypothetical protein C8J56DRAFT_524271 [Mycena floridula]|nr:hypothetical protein C8J56DRAFT_524271 [Mycena floridula]
MQSAGLPADNAVWNKYIHEAGAFDKEMVHDWNLTMDVLLVFAALFSAILTAFIIEFYHLLQVDTQQMTVDLLRELVILTRNPNAASILPPLEAQFTPGRGAIWLNTLWFTSLTCSLGTAMAAILVKQWLQSYSLNLQIGTTQQYALRRQYRYNTLLRWHVPTIISILPMILQLSVLLFVFGLAVALWSVNFTIAVLVMGLAGVVLVMYTLSVILPIFYSDCPYKTSVSILIERFFNLLAFISVHLLVKLQHFTQLAAVLPTHLDRRPTITSHQRFALREVTSIQDKADDLSHDSIIWLFGASQTKDVQELALGAIVNVNHTPGMVQKFLEHDVFERLAEHSLVKLPGRDDTFWKAVTYDMSMGYIQALNAHQPFMMSLLAAWHHDAFLSETPPPAISKLHTKSSSHSWLMGDWVLLWRHLNKQDVVLKRIQSQHGDLHSLAAAICVEMIFYQLQVCPDTISDLQIRHSRSFNMDDPSPIYDLYNLLELTIASENVRLEPTILLLLRTLKFVLLKVTVVTPEAKQELLMLLLDGFSRQYISQVNQEIFWHLVILIKILPTISPDLLDTHRSHWSRKRISPRFIAETLSHLIRDQLAVFIDKDSTIRGGGRRARTIITRAAEELFQLLMFCPATIPSEIPSEVGIDVLANLSIHFVEPLVLLAIEPRTWSSRNPLESYTTLLGKWYTNCSELSLKDRKQILVALYDLMMVRHTCSYSTNIDTIILKFLIEKSENDLEVMSTLCELLRISLHKVDISLVKKFIDLEGPAQMRYLMKPQGTRISDRQKSLQRKWTNFQKFHVSPRLGNYTYDTRMYNLCQQLLAEN